MPRNGPNQRVAEWSGERLGDSKPRCRRDRKSRDFPGARETCDFEVCVTRKMDLSKG